MPNLEDYKLGKSFKVQLSGPNGTGKSIAAGSFHKAGHLYIADFDGRVEPVAKHYRGKTKDISYNSFGVDDFRTFIDWLDKVQDMTTPITPEGKVFRTLVIDSITMLSILCVVYQLKKKGKISTTKGGLPKTGWDEINGETVLLTQALEIMKILNENHGINIIICTHPVTKTNISTSNSDDEDDSNKGKSKSFESIMAYGNKLPGIVPCYFNEVYRVSVKKVNLNPVKYGYIAMTRGLNADNEVIAKSALDLPDEIDITNGLYDAIMKHLNPEVK